MRERASQQFGVESGCLVVEGGEDCVEDAVGSADVGFDVVGGAFSPAGAVDVVEEHVEDERKGYVVFHGYSSSAFNHVESFFEFGVVWPEDYGDAVDCGFVDVVDSCSETSAYVGGFAIAVDA